MPYKLAVFDVDGTLRGPEQKFISERTIAAINSLREKGVIAAIASGRPPAYLRPQYLEGLRVDYSVCVNGSCVIDSSGFVIGARTLSGEQMNALLSLYDSHNAMVDFVFYEGHFAYSRFEEMRQYFLLESGQVDDFFNGESRTRHLKDMPYGAFICVEDDVMKQFTDAHPDLKASPYKSGAYDVYITGCEKAYGVSRILEATGITWDEVVAFGDGYNDVELLQSAGLGVALGNASSEVKATANRVIGLYSDDAVAWELSRLFGV